MKALKYILLYCATILSCGTMHAQNTIFLAEGKIEFEKKLNMYSMMDEGDSWSDLQKKTMPKFKSTYFDLALSLKTKPFTSPAGKTLKTTEICFLRG